MIPYVHTTLAQSLVRVKRARVLPYSGEVIVRPGQDVTAVQVIARAPQSDQYQVIYASDWLKVATDKIEPYLLVEAGAVVEKGTPLMSKRGFPRQKVYPSPVDGTIHGIRNGRLIIQQTQEWLELRAVVPGRVSSYVSDRGVILEITGMVIQGIWGTGKEANGKFKALARTTDAVFSAEQLNDETSERILLIGKIERAELLQNLVENNVQGVIVGSLTSEYKDAVSTLPFPVIVLEGFGQQNISGHIFQLLQQANAQEISLIAPVDSTDKRPEIIVPADSTVAPTPEYKPLAVGQMVRLLREPYTSMMGEVKRLYHYAQSTPLRTKAQGADVELLDGRVVFVPYANLDAIQ